MILDMFIVIVGICLFLIWFGIYAKRKLFSIVGLSIFFILSSWIILYSSSGYNLSGLEYRTGQVITQSGFSSIVTYQYATYNDGTTFWVGFLFNIVSLFGLVIVWGMDE